MNAALKPTFPALTVEDVEVSKDGTLSIQLYDEDGDYHYIKTLGLEMSCRMTFPNAEEHEVCYLGVRNIVITTDNQVVLLTDEQRSEVNDIVSENAYQLLIKDAAEAAEYHSYSHLLDGV